VSHETHQDQRAYNANASRNGDTDLNSAGEQASYYPDLKYFENKMLEGEAAGQREREVKGVIDSADIIYYAEGFTQRVFVLYYLFLEHPSPFTR